MILTNAPVNEAIVSNVSEIGEFRIRNSAKAFSILSSGLYANKIRAIVRELSCNAVDSHAAAGKQDVPFDVHLPNQLEPHFSIRDYGVGLSHDQVTQIYTTYFESTKTNSNEFIGALGLGSKSPFSYTDNFTVTAIKDGVRGIYSAFINEQGVPSIALMMQEKTDEPSGVEVKFSVNDYYDYGKFRNEAQTVYTYFTLRPVVSGCAGFEFTDIAYERKDIVPGVHSISHRGSSVAVMGNIAYPIDVPQSSTAMGELNNLLNCGLEIHFGIGELDFQASREGLSYIPQTINAIKHKLELLNESLANVLALEADAITNLWDRAIFLNNKRQHSLWSAAAAKYATDTKLVTYANSGHNSLTRWSLKVEDLAKDYNIVLKGFCRSRHSKGINLLKTSVEYAPGHAKNSAGNYITYLAWSLGVDSDSHFVVNDLKTGALERSKYHYRETKMYVYQRNVFIIEAADKTRAIESDKFFAMLHYPPADRIFKASSLTEKPRKTGAGIGKNVTIMALERRGGSGYRRSDNDMVWRAAGNIDSFDKNTKFYYVPLSGFIMESTKGYTDGKQLYDEITSLPGLFTGTIYGVRKGDIEEVKKRKNWFNLETHIESVITVKNNNFLLSVVKSKLDSDNILNYNNDVVNQVNPKSPFAQVATVFKNITNFTGNAYNLENLFKKFAPNSAFSPDALVNKYQVEINNVRRRYPLLKEIGTYRNNASDIAEYINLIDTKKGL